MNIHNYLLPAALAATVHVALFWALPEGTRPNPTTIAEIPILPPIPKSENDPVMRPPEERGADAEPVQPLAGGRAPPELPEEFITRKPDRPTTPLVEHLKNSDKTGRIIPESPGPGSPGRNLRC